MNRNQYKNIPIRDSHMHVWREMPLVDTVAFHSWVLEEFGYETISVMAICEQKPEPTRAIMQNLKTMYLKKVLSPRVYAYAGLHFQGLTPEDDGSYFLEQAKYYNACGYDGIKMFYPISMYLQGYPFIRLSDPRFEKFFGYMEETGMPITLHLGGPEVCFGDINEIPESQRKWHIGDCPVHLFDMFADFTGMMDKFPNLKIVVAHFAFITWHMDWAEEWLAKYENLSLDLTPSLFMYFDFQEKPEAWTKFFLKYADRIIYGTDIGSNTLDVEKKEPYALTHVVRGFFEESEEIHEFDEVFYPMELPDWVLQKIYKDNIMRYYGGEPRKANYSLMLKEVELEESREHLTELARENLRIMKEEFSRAGTAGISGISL